MEIKGKRQLFIDQRFIEESKNVTLEVKKPVKTGELTIARSHSPHHRIGGYNSIIYDEGIYKLYYGETLYKEEGVYVYVCYATSEDGIHFVKPSLNLAAHYPEKDNNIILGFGAGDVEYGLGDGGCMVFLDPKDEVYKYKLLARHELKRHIGLYQSKDGIHFEYAEEMIFDDGRFDDIKDGQVKGFHLDSQNIIFYDSSIEKYVAYVRKNFEIAGQHRTIARAVSDDLLSFPKVTEMEVVLRADEKDQMYDNHEFGVRAQTIDFYTCGALKYQEAQDVYVMFPSLYYKYNENIDYYKENHPMNAGPIDIRFASSRDGIKWNRHDRSSYVGLGSKDDFDAYALYMVHGIVPGKNNDMYMYYKGGDIIHGYHRGDKHESRENKLLDEIGVGAKNNTTAISRLLLRKDGFVSAKSSYEGGFIKTPALSFEGSKLLLNLDTAACGNLKVALLDENDQVVKGYSLDDCDLIHTCNDTSKVVTFKGNADVSQLQGQKIKIYFEMRDCELYAFQFVK